jgi:hypothetical protein
MSKISQNDHHPKSTKLRMSLAIDISRHRRRSTIKIDAFEHLTNYGALNERAR